MPVRKVRGEPVPGEFPGLVPQAQSLHARHRAEGAGDRRVNSLDPLGPQRHRAPMIAEDRGPRKRGVRVGKRGRHEPGLAPAPACGSRSDTAERPDPGRYVLLNAGMTWAAKRSSCSRITACGVPTT